MGQLEGFIADLGTMVDQQERLIAILEGMQRDTTEQKELLHRTFALLDEAVGVYLNSQDQRR